MCRHAPKKDDSKTRGPCSKVVGARNSCHNRRCCPADRALDERDLDARADDYAREDAGDVVCNLRCGVVRAATDATTIACLLADVSTLAIEQRVDADISPIYARVDEGREKPSWDDVAPFSEMTKTLWRQFDRLSLMDGVLSRRFETADGHDSWQQVILPRVTHGVS